MSHPCFHYKKPELLSPAGDLECFFAAVENGADAVYFGLRNFSARAGAQNLTLDDAGKAIAYAHERSVRVYIALNTLVKTAELEMVVDYLVALEELQPDALILHDLGLLHLVQSKFPSFHIHASTQMAIHNSGGVKQLEKMGFQRVVLARELSIDEIRTISQNSPLEIEVFVHGALCYSYSGLCLFSSMIGGRSGNRGRCAQPCRMYYKSPSGEGGHLFSMRDLLTLSHANELMSAGVCSFKIEGRMKSPEYVAVVTHIYRQAIDGKLEDKDEAIHLAGTVFTRETTSSYLTEGCCIQSTKITGSGCKATDMVNPAYPANMGSYAGEIIKSAEGCVVIKADVEIGIRDLLQVFENVSGKPSLLPVKKITVNGKNVFGVKAGSIAVLVSEQQYKPGAKLYLLSSLKVREKFASKIPKKLITAKVPVDLEIKIESDGIRIKGTARHVSFRKDYSRKLEKGINRITDLENINKCFSRLGETPFRLAGIHTDMSDTLFVPLSILNEIRRDYFQNLSEVWRIDKEHRCESIKKWIKGKAVEEECSFNNVSEEGMRLSLKADRLHYLNYIPLEKIYKIHLLLTDETIGNLIKNEDTVTTLSKIKDKVVLSLPAIMRDTENGHMVFGYYKEVVEDLIAQGFRQFQLSNPGALELFVNEDVSLHADYPFYCLNPLSARKLKELGFCRYTLSPEDDKENLQALFSSDADLIVYQDTPLFTSEACVWANMKKDCPGRNQCGFKQITLENEHGDRFIAMNEECKTVVIGQKPFSIVHLIPKLLESGQSDFRIDLCYRDYTPEMIQEIFSAIQTRGKVKNAMMGNFERGLQ